MSVSASRGVTGVLIAASVLVAALVAPSLSSVPDGLTARFQLTYMNLVFAAYAAALATFVSWRVGDRAGARELAVLLALMSLSLTLSIVPSGDASTLHRVAFASAWTVQVLWVLYFWTRFPRPMDAAAARALAAQPKRGMWYDGLNRGSARLVAWGLGSTAGRISLVVSAAAFGWMLVGLDVSPYNFLGHRLEAGVGPMLFGGAISSVIIFMIAFVAWTAFRVADERGRRQVLWILLAHLITAMLTVLNVSLYGLADWTGSPVLGTARDWVTMAFFPVGWTLTLSAYALALFVAGAFDLRPVIGRSTVYGFAIITLTVLFAAVEELVEAQVATRFAVAEGAGTWVGAISIAVFLGPIRTRLERLLKRLVPEL